MVISGGEWCYKQTVDKKRDLRTFCRWSNLSRFTRFWGDQSDHKFAVGGPQLILRAGGWRHLDEQVGGCGKCKTIWKVWKREIICTNNLENLETLYVKGETIYKNKILKIMGERESICINNILTNFLLAIWFSSTYGCLGLTVNLGYLKIDL